MATHYTDHNNNSIKIQLGEPMILGWGVIFRNMGDLKPAHDWKVRPSRQDDSTDPASLELHSLQPCWQVGEFLLCSSARVLSPSRRLLILQPWVVLLTLVSFHLPRHTSLFISWVSKPLCSFLKEMFQLRGNCHTTTLQFCQPSFLHL